jgi:hypothetical protein
MLRLDLDQAEIVGHRAVTGCPGLEDAPGIFVGRDLRDDPPVAVVNEQQCHGGRSFSGLRVPAVSNAR